MSFFVRLLTAFVVALLVAALAGCGSSSPTDPRAPRANGFASCVVGDVSGSTRAIRPRYVSAFRSFAAAEGNDGSGALCLVLAAGDPQSEQAPMTTYVGPVHRGNSSYAPGEVRSAVDTATQQFGRMLIDPPAKRPGSAIAEAAAVTAPMLHRGDRLLLATDGIQSSDLTGDFHHADLSTHGIEMLLARLARAHLMPELRGVRVQMPLILAHPGGTSLGQEREASIRRFWEAWAQRAHTSIDFSVIG